jgi:selenide,water dikinase
VATVDFFTPVVDDAASWGAIAAANALSDVYAMGATPLFALNLVAWPRASVPFELLGDVLRGATDVMRKAGCLMLGGHSIEDNEPKFGMAVIGEVHPDRVLTVAGAKAGDFLVLTKPLGTGILSTALKREALLEGGMSEAIQSMITLNDGAARAAREAEVHACTDVTGFGLLGHLDNILTASRKGAEIWLEEIPVFPHVRNLAARGLIPGGTERNLEAAANVRWDPSLDATEKILCVDAQTSGGLLMAVAPERHATLLAALEREGTPAAATIGRVTGAAGVVHVSRSRR